MTIASLAMVAQSLPLTTGVPSALIFLFWDSANTGALLSALLRAVPSLLTHVVRHTVDTAARDDGFLDLHNSDSFGEWLPLPKPRVIPMSISL